MADLFHAGGLTDEGSFDPTDKLFAGDLPRQEKKIVIVTGQSDVLERGALLSVVTASGKGTLYDSGGSGGAEVAKYILAHQVDAQAADAEAIVYSAGCFSTQEVIDKTDGLASVSDTLAESLRDYGIHLRRTVRGA